MKPKKFRAVPEKCWRCGKRRMVYLIPICPVCCDSDKKIDAWMRRKK